jgi:hypothetical protein
VGDGSPGSREAEGEGGEGFYIAQSGGCSDLLVIWAGGARLGGGWYDVALSDPQSLYRHRPREKPAWPAESLLA